MLTTTIPLLQLSLAILVGAAPLYKQQASISATNITTASVATSSPPLEPRVPANSYKAAVRKGKNMWAMMNDPMRTKQSVWVPSDVQRWGWVVKSDQNDEVFNDKTSGLEAALEVLQVSSPTSMTVRIEHIKDVKIDGIAYPATNAEYCAVYSPAKGLIVASDRHSPSYRKSTSSHLSKSPLPQLQYWSDLTFLSWYLLTSANNEQQSSLRYIFVRGITNRATQQLISEAMRIDGYKNKEVLPWPNFWMFTPNGQHGKLSDPFLAVLGTENFAGIAPLLAQHQQVLGKKTIKSVRMWGDGGKSLVLHGMVELQ